jgi:hypothetical protein
MTLNFFWPTWLLRNFHRTLFDMAFLCHSTLSAEEGVQAPDVSKAWLELLSFR